MSIIIHGIKMPTSCWDCPCAYFTEGVHHNYCQAVGYDTEITDDGKPDWCPLIELPPHGRLVDADALCPIVDDEVEHAKENWRQSFKSFPVSGDLYAEGFMDGARQIADLLSDAPTVIPADREEDT